MNEIDLDASRAQADAILAAAGWHPHPDWNGHYAKDNLVGGIQPDQQGCHFKDWTKIPPGHPLYSADTPDMPHEAAEWLVVHCGGATIKAENESLNGMVSRDEALFEVRDPPRADAPAGEQDDSASVLLSVSGEILEGAEAETQPIAAGSADEGDHESIQQCTETTGETDAEPLSDVRDAEFTDASSGLFEPEAGGVDVPPVSSGASSQPIDADFTAFGDPETASLEGADLSPGSFLLENDPNDIAVEEPVQRPLQDAPQDRFIGLDDLDRVKRLRIGDVAAAAAVRVAAVEASVGEHVGEYAAIQGYVVTNLDKHTGAFMPQDEASTATYRRFVELDAARSQVFSIDQHRKAATAWLLEDARTREEIVAFDPDAGWP